MTARIPAVIFAYAGDALPVRECVRGALLSGFLPVVVDDAANPIPRHLASWIEQAGAQYRQSHFRRRGNLNGTESIRGICGELVEAMQWTRAPYAVKLDADTIILSPDSFSGNRGICSTTQGRRAAFGCAYSLTEETANAVAEYYADSADDSLPEDLGIWGAVHSLGHPCRMDEFQPDGGPLSAIPSFQFSMHDLIRFDVVTFGNRPPGGWLDRGLQIAGLMHQLNLFRETRHE